MEPVTIKSVNDRISYIPACDRPLSSDIGIIYGDRHTYLYDVGSTIGDLDFLHGLSEPPVIVISHFHADHTWWLTEHRAGDPDVSPDDSISTCYTRPSYSALYVSPQTLRHTHDGTVVREPVVIEDGVRLEILPVPSSHAKGCLALSVDDSFIFMGDSTYACSKGYNTQQLKALIGFLEQHPADHVLLSHDRHFVRPKEVVIRQLKSYYDHRIPGETYIVTR